MEATTIIRQMNEQMDKAIKHTLHEFSTLHTGKATPAMVEAIQVHIEAYGSNMALREIAAITTPEPRLIAITPWDKNTIKDIEKAIRSANIGLNPVPQGNMLRVPVPELSGERRQELVKVCHKLAEEGRVAIRHVRHVAIDTLKKLQKAGTLSEDDLKRAEKQVQTDTDKHTNDINKALAAKEKELTTV